MSRFVGTVPNVVGLVWPSLRPKSRSKLEISGRILTRFQGPLRSAQFRLCSSASDHRASGTGFGPVLAASLLQTDQKRSQIARTPYFRLCNSASGPRTGLPGPILDRLQAYCKRTKHRPQIARAFGPGSLGPLFGSVCVRLAAKTKPVQTGPGRPVRGPEALLHNPILCYANRAPIGAL